MWTGFQEGRCSTGTPSPATPERLHAVVGRLNIRTQAQRTTGPRLFFLSCGRTLDLGVLKLFSLANQVAKNDQNGSSDKSHGSPYSLDSVNIKKKN